MAKFYATQFFTVCKDAEGKGLTYDVEPTKDQIKEAIKSKQQLVLEELPLTIKYAITKCLRTDLTRENNPDPHEDKKYEIYSLIRRITNIDISDGSVDIESEEISIIKERAKRLFVFELYGFLVDFLEGRITE